ncbi:phosphoglycerate kinase [Candidatus Kuenenbacteria bacterium]|nr:phosphoglycerate kinase [Candidatus Kuenenbacteria bacterium]
MKNKLRTIKSVNLKNKHIVLRVDFNVPVKNGKVLDDTKIERALPTIKYLLKQRCKLAIVSHFGRPEGRQVKKLSLEPVYAVLKNKLPKAAIQFKNGIPKLASSVLAQNDIVLLENIRFDKREDENSVVLAKELAKMGEVFVNEAFAFAHRKTASTVAITKLLPSYAGLNFADEVKFLTKALTPKKPAVALIGGAKVKTKFEVVENFLKIYSKVMVAGGVANTFLAAQGYDIGDSISDPSKISKAKKLLKSTKMLLPRDVLVSNKNQRKVRVVKIEKQKVLCKKGEQIMDIGPETIKYYSQQIKKAKTIVWGGPLGMFEKPKFSHGTLAIAKLIGSRGSKHAIVIAGGGETTLAIEMSKMEKYYDFISTGGGAMLEFLSGNILPGIKSLLK